MKKSRSRFNNLVDRKSNQAKVLYFPENWRSAYSAYTALYSGGLLRNSAERASLKEIVKHTFLLCLWIGVLTLFFASQRGLLHNRTIMMPESRSIEARLMQTSRGTL